MQTDIPLKLLTLLRAADLLPLLGMPDAQVLAVETLELPAGATRLDNVLRLWSAHGQEFLHVVEWQGYHDPTVLWRFAGYLAWLGQRHPGKAVTGTLIYLTPADDTGNTLRQEVDGQMLLEWPMPCIRLWEQDAVTALASGNLGLTVLSPLMRNASEGLVEQAIMAIMSQAAMPQQADLLSILGVFAEPLFAPDRFVRLVGKEKLVESRLLDYLAGEKLAMADEKLTHMEEKLTHMEEKLAVAGEKLTIAGAKLAELEAELEAARQAELEAVRRVALHHLQTMLEEAVIARFPDAPIALVHNIRQVTDPQQLQQLNGTVIRAADLAEFERALAQISAS